MKQLIKTFPVILLVIISLNNYAQEIKLKGGLNYSWVTYYNNGENRSDEISPRLGYQLGANAILHVSRNYSINAGTMMMKRKNDWMDIPEPNNEYHFETTRWYLEFPVLMRREFRFNEFSLFGELGPYAGIGLTSDQSYKYYYNGKYDKEGNLDRKWGTGDYDFKRVDFGYNIGFGLLIKKLEIGISYEHGIINYRNADWLEYKNRAFILNCAYTLFSKKE